MVGCAHTYLTPAAFSAQRKASGMNCKYPMTEDQSTVFLATARQQIEEKRHEAEHARDLARACTREAKVFRADGRTEIADRRDQQARDCLDKARYCERLRAADEMYYALWLLLLTTGLRPSEALGAKWSDLNGKGIDVRRSLDRLGNLNAPKTDKSRRTVMLSGIVQDAIDAHRRKQAALMEERREAGEPYEDNGFVFATHSGKPLDQTNVKRQKLRPLADASGINKQRKEAGYPPPTLYDMRHTAASTLAAKGAHISAVAELMGHASTKMTADVYTHVMPSMRAGLPELLSDAYGLSNAAPKPVS